MTDAGTGRNHAEVLECLLAPLQEAVTLAIALIFKLDVSGKRRRRAEFVNDNRVVDHEVDGNERIDLFRVATERHHGIAHSGEIDHSRNAGEVLHENAGGTISDFVFGQALIVQPLCNGQNMLLGDGLAVLETKQVFQKNFHGIGELGNALQAVCLSLGKAEIDVVLTINGKDGTTMKTVE